MAESEWTRKEKVLIGCGLASGPIGVYLWGLIFGWWHLPRLVTNGDHS